MNKERPTPIGVILKGRRKKINAFINVLFINRTNTRPKRTVIKEIERIYKYSVYERTIEYRRSTIEYRRSTIEYRRSTIEYRRSTIEYTL